MLDIKSIITSKSWNQEKLSMRSLRMVLCAKDNHSILPFTVCATNWLKNLSTAGLLPMTSFRSVLKMRSPLSNNCGKFCTAECVDMAQVTPSIFYQAHLTILEGDIVGMCTGNGM